MYLPEDKALMCLQLLVEGCSVRSIERVTGVHRDTVLRLLEVVGKKCIWVQETLVRNVKVGFVEADEIWSYVAMKDRAKVSKGIVDKEIGTTYTFTAIDTESKMIVAWQLGTRTEADALMFLKRLRNAVSQDAVFQLSTDSFPGYNQTVPAILGNQVHYGQITKTYGMAPSLAEARYSPAECIGCKKTKKLGNPIKDKISTSIVERANLTMRMSMRRFTRLTNGFSKKWDNLHYSIALHFAHYNFCRSHKTLNGATPAMAAGLTSTIWSLKDLLNVTKDVHSPA
jgi:IS1 family transposase